jgi:predicted membrane-bound mannosyltransferase
MPGARTMAGIYMLLAIVGALVPLTAFLPWLGDNGLNMPRFVGALFVNPVSRFFAWDVILSALTLVLFILVDGRREGVRPLWLPIVATGLIGVSCGLPLFLALRARKARP